MSNFQKCTELTKPLTFYTGFHIRLHRIEELRNKHPRAIPVWVEGKLGQDLSFNFGHNIPLGASGAFLNFGFKADEKLDFTMNRLVHFKRSVGKNLADENEQMKLLKLMQFMLDR